MKVATNAEDENFWPARIDGDRTERGDPAPLPDAIAVRSWLWPERGFWLFEWWKAWRERRHCARTIYMQKFAATITETPPR